MSRLVAFRDYLRCTTALLTCHLNKAVVQVQFLWIFYVNLIFKFEIFR